MLHQPEGKLDVTEAVVFEQRYVVRVIESQLFNTWQEAMVHLHEVANLY